jgi:aspartate aminotransferase
VISRKVTQSMQAASWIRRMFEEGARLKERHGADQVFDFSLVSAAGTREPGAHRYMPNAGYPAVRDAVAAYLGQATGLPFEGRNVVMCVGAGGGLNVTLKALLDPGEEVVVLAPYFVEYRFYVDNHGGVPVVVQTDDAFQPDLAALEAALTPRTKAVFVNSPNNPTGVVYPRRVLDELGELLRVASARHGRRIYLVTDEPYRHIAYGVEVPWVFHSYQDTVLVTSHSKDLALPGERIGYVVPHPGLETLAQLVGALTFATRTLGFVNAPATQQRAVASLQGQTVDPALYRRKRDVLYPALVEAGYDVVEPHGAFYLFPRSPDPDDVAFARELQEERVLVVPGTGFDRPGHFRVSYCVEDDVIERALPAFRRVAERHRR